MIITTTPSIEGRRIVDYRGIVFGEVVSGVDFVRDLAASFTNFFGGRSGGDLKQNDALPSVRTLAKELKISALTVKKAYDNLEQEGFTVTIHGKGTYVAASNKERILEELKREIESDLEKVVQKARGCGLDDSQIREMLELIMED